MAVCSVALGPVQQQHQPGLKVELVQVGAVVEVAAEAQVQVELEQQLKQAKSSLVSALPAEHPSQPLFRSKLESPGQYLTPPTGS